MSGTPVKIAVIGVRGLGNLQGGVERFCSSFYSKLPSDKFDITVFVRHPVRSVEMPAHVRTYYVPVPRSPAVETLLHSLMSVLAARKLGMRTLHIHGIGPCLVLPLASALGMRAIVRHVGADYDRRQWGRLAKAMLRTGEQFAAQYAESIVCLNSQIADRFSRVTGRTSRVFILPNGVDPLPQTLPISILRQLAIVEGRYILAVGRLVSDKNFHVLVQAFFQTKLPPDVRLVIVGAVDREKAYFRLLMKTCADQSRIVFAGQVFGADLWSLYMHAGLFVIPSAHEGMSFSLLEAAIAGAKIIASDIPANSTVCREYARLVAVDSIDALGEAIDSEWIRERGNQEIAYQMMLCRFRHDWRAIVGSMIPILLPSDRNQNIYA